MDTLNQEVGLLTVFVRNLERAREFYTGVLGLQLVEELTYGSIVMLRPVRGPLIALEFDVAMFTPGADPVGVEIGIAVNNLEAVWQRWQAYGTPVINAPHDFALGRAFVGKGPEGHRLRVYQLREGFSFVDPEGINRVIAHLGGLVRPS
ncbi:MAG: hypothetical protein Kow0077_01430 [Anaerolineae bacterium]